MLKVDTETMMICLTRGDTANIVFGAVTKEGDPWNPDTDGQQLTFAVSKKWGGERLMEITNTYDSTKEDALDKFWTITIGKDDWLEGTADKFKFQDYVFDVQILTATGADTIIGKTDEITPTFRVWGEVAEE